MIQLARRAGVAAVMVVVLLAAAAAQAQKVTFKDPAEDDDGPGKYTYPTDPVYKPGSFDLTGFELKVKGDKLEVRVDVAAKLADVWNTGSGFSLQTVFIFVQTADRRLKKTESKATLRAKAEEAKTAVGAAAAAATAAGAAAAAPAPAGPAAAGPAAAGGAAGEKTATGAAAGEKPAAGAAGAATPAEAAAAAGSPTGAGSPAAAAAGKGASGKVAAGKGAPPQAAKPPPGITAGLPGLDVQFGPEDAWDRCIILSPAPAAQVRAAVEALAPGLKDKIVVPDRVEGSGHAISASFDRKALEAADPKGGPKGSDRADPKKWGYQVVLAGYDPYPASGDLLVRRVNEVEGQHRFGGGTDGNCSPNVLDVLAPDGEGEQDEVQEQHQMLQYECNPDHSAKKLATLQMVRMPDPEEEKRLEKEERRRKRQEENTAPAEKPNPAAVPPPATNGPG